MKQSHLALFDPKLLQPALLDVLRKLSPGVQLHNPVMFVCFVGSIVTTALLLKPMAGAATNP